MNLRILKQHARLFALAALALTLAGVFLARTAFARITVNTIDPVSIIADNGRQIIVTGPVTCDQNEWADQRVTVTQRETGAVAEGHVRFTCTTERQQWEVRALTQGNATFQAGPATAVAFCRSTVRGEATDAHQWLVNITLVNQ
jgi:hypothetical protein